MIRLKNDSVKKGFSVAHQTILDNGYEMTDQRIGEPKDGQNKIRDGDEEDIGY